MEQSDSKLFGEVHIFCFTSRNALGFASETISGATLYKLFQRPLDKHHDTNAQQLPFAGKTDTRIDLSYTKLILISADEASYRGRFANSRSTAAAHRYPLRCLNRGEAYTACPRRVGSRLSDCLLEISCIAIAFPVAAITNEDSEVRFRHSLAELSPSQQQWPTQPVPASIVDSNTAHKTPHLDIALGLCFSRRAAPDHTKHH